MESSTLRLVIAAAVALATVGLIGHLAVCGEIGRLAWVRWTGESRGRLAKAIGWIRRYGTGVMLAALIATPTSGHVVLELAAGAIVLVASVLVSRMWVGWLVRSIVRDADRMDEAPWSAAIGATKRELFELAYRSMLLRAIRWFVAPACIGAWLLTAAWAIAQALRSSEGVPDYRTFVWFVGATLAVSAVTFAFVLICESFEPRGVLVERVLAPEPPPRSEASSWFDRMDAPWSRAPGQRSLREQVRGSFAVHAQAMLAPVRFQPAAFRDASKTARQDLLRRLAIAVNHESRDFEREWHEVLSVIVRRSDPRGEIADDWEPPTPISSAKALVAYAVAVISLVGVVAKLSPTFLELIARVK